MMHAPATSSAAGCYPGRPGSRRTLRWLPSVEPISAGALPGGTVSPVPPGFLCPICLVLSVAVPGASYRETGTSCHRPPLRLRLLPLAWPGAESPM